MKINLNNEKNNLLKKLDLLNKELSFIENEYNINLSELTSKISNTVKNLEKNEFSIAFFGAFSDGKSTILSALTNRLDIKISPKPTTDKIQIYEFEGYKIIDTPGLFSENLMHDKLTKKYISEANVILYTVDPVNPLKESHLKTVKWILFDLNKIDSIIFVINKMDEIADLEDEEDFIRNLEIKKEVILDTIREIKDYKGELKIVGIAADPYGEGLEYWLNNIEEYRQLSRIETLENIIFDFIEKYKEELIIKAGFSVIKDSILKIEKELEKVSEILSLKKEQLKNQINEIENNLSILEKDINRSYMNIKKEIMELREEILINIDAASDLNTLSKVIQNKIGKEGYILEENVNLIIQKHTQKVLDENKQVVESLKDSLNFYLNMENELLNSLSPATKTVLKSILGSTSTRALADTILYVKKVLNIPFKFKPWGAVKFAKVLKGLPVVIDCLEFAFKIYSKYKTDKIKNDIKNEIEDMFKKLINEEITLENYINNYFSNVKELNEILNTLKNGEKKIEKSINNIEEIKKRLKLYNNL
jgi:small GTP-binding protein